MRKEFGGRSARYGVLLLVLISALVATQPAYSHGAHAQRPPIIDMHLHAVSAGFWGSPDPAWFPPHLERAATDSSLLQETLTALRQYNVVKAATSGPMEWVDRWHAADPTRFIRATNFSTACTPDLLTRLRAAHTTGGYEIMGEISWQWRGVAFDDSQVGPCFALAEELDLPMGIHVGLGYPGAAYRTRYRASAGRPLALEEMLVRHPKARVYLMHAGWPLLDETVALMFVHPQVYADLSFINWYVPRAEFHRYLRALVDAGLGDRLMYGSDAGVFPAAIRLSIEAIETASFLTDQQKRDIFYNNAARFLRLAGAGPPARK